MESDGARPNNLLALLVKALAMKGGLEPTTIASKLMYFGADGVSTRISLPEVHYKNFNANGGRITMQMVRQCGSLNSWPTL